MAVMVVAFLSPAPVTLFTVGMALPMALAEVIQGSELGLQQVLQLHVQSTYIELSAHYMTGVRCITCLRQQTTVPVRKCVEAAYA